MITIYHNPRCRKSREGLEILKNSGKPFSVVKYLEEPLGENEIRILLKKLGLPPESVIRTGEAVWKEKYKGREMNASDRIRAMAEHPKLIERPIVETENEAVLGRPPENIQTLLNRQ